MMVSQKKEWWCDWDGLVYPFVYLCSIFGLCFSIITGIFLIIGNTGFVTTQNIAGGVVLIVLGVFVMPVVSGLLGGGLSILCCGLGHYLGEGIKLLKKKKPTTTITEKEQQQYYEDAMEQV